MGLNIMMREVWMRYVKWIFRALILGILIAFLHYTLPQTDIVRITNTYEKRVDFQGYEMFWADGARDAAGNLLNRDIFFIETFTAKGAPMVYRNEDTSWNWPPYFKFDTSNLQAEASNAKSLSDSDGPYWVAIKHYGWRNEFLSIWPNAVSIEPVSGPDVRIIPWMNLLILAVLAAVLWALRVRWIKFRKKRLDPTFERIDDSLDDFIDWVKRMFSHKAR
jgi:hypothetical protein